MTDLVIVVPSRGRPAAAHELAQLFNNTTTTRPGLVFAVGEDDPTLPEYRKLTELTLGFPLVIQAVPPTDRPSSMNHMLNGVGVWLAKQDGGPYAVGFMGDDMRPRTHGWDRTFVNALHDLGSGIVYGNDLFQGERLPTQWAMTSDIVRALGQMTPPALWHMYVDDYIRDLGQAASAITYLDDVVIEHLHPLAGKAAVDESYARTNSATVYGHDQRIYDQYRRSGRFERDVEKVRALRAPCPAA